MRGDPHAYYFVCFMSVFSGWREPTRPDEVSPIRRRLAKEDGNPQSYVNPSRQTFVLRQPASVTRASDSQSRYIYAYICIYIYIHI